MKKIIVISLLLLTNLPMHAQSTMTDAEKAEAKDRYLEYREKLNLDEKQCVQVETINQSFFEGLVALRNSNGSKISKYKRYKSLKSQKDKQMKKVLTAEQYTIYEAFQKEIKEEFKENRRMR